MGEEREPLRRSSGRSRASSGSLLGDRRVKRAMVDSLANSPESVAPQILAAPPRAATRRRRSRCPRSSASFRVKHVLRAVPVLLPSCPRPNAASTSLGVAAGPRVARPHRAASCGTGLSRRHGPRARGGSAAPAAGVAQPPPAGNGSGAQPRVSWRAHGSQPRRPHGGCRPTGRPRVVAGGLGAQPLLPAVRRQALRLASMLAAVRRAPRRRSAWRRGRRACTSCDVFPFCPRRRAVCHLRAWPLQLAAQPPVARGSAAGPSTKLTLTDRPELAVIRIHRRPPADPTRRTP